MARPAVIATLVNMLDSWGKHEEAQQRLENAADAHVSLLGQEQSTPAFTRYAIGYNIKFGDFRAVAKRIDDLEEAEQISPEERIEFLALKTLALSWMSGSDDAGEPLRRRSLRKP
eukprot:scaffold1397_cov254-Pinguiococcus_pyrenoidosus.AAC.25